MDMPLSLIHIFVTEVNGKREASILPDPADRTKCFGDGKYNMYNYWDGEYLVSDLLKSGEKKDEPSEEKAVSYTHLKKTGTRCKT